MLKNLKRTILGGLNLGAHPIDEDERRLLDPVLRAEERIEVFARGRDGADAVLFIATHQQLVIVERGLFDPDIHAIPLSDVAHVQRTRDRWGTTLEIRTAWGKAYRAAAVDEAQAMELVSFVTGSPTYAPPRTTDAGAEPAIGRGTHRDALAEP